MRVLVLCAVAALTACGGGGSSAPVTSSPGPGLVVSWVSRSGASGGSGTQNDAIHLASPSSGVFVTASRGGVGLSFNLTADPTCTAVAVGSGSSNISVAFDPNAPPPVTIVPFGPGTWDVTWTIVSASKGTCTVTVTTFDGAKATLQVFSGL